MFCGEVAAEAILKRDISKKFLSKYDARWKKRFLNHYKAGRFGLKTIEKMSDAELDEVMRALEGVNISRELSKHNVILNSIRMGFLLLWNNPKLMRFVKYLF